MTDDEVMALMDERAVRGSSTAVFCEVCGCTHLRSMPRHDKAYCAMLGHRGGNTTKARYGSAHYRKIQKLSTYVRSKK